MKPPLRLAFAVLVSAIAAVCVTAQARRSPDPHTRRAPRAAPTEQHDVVIFVADDLGWAELAAATTPRLDAFRSLGMTFTRLYTQTNCSPSRINFLTGRQPLPAYGIGTIVEPGAAGGTPYAIPINEETFVDVVRAEGYKVATFGKWHVYNDEVEPPPLENSPKWVGFNSWRAMSKYGVGPGYAGGTTGASTWVRIDDDGAGQGVMTNETTYATTAVADAFSNWWRNTPSPKMAVVSFNAPHSPFHVPPSGLLSDPPTGSTTSQEKYLLMIEALDTEIGRVVDEAVDLEDAIVFFIGDNGPPNQVAFEPTYAKGTMYDGGVSPPAFAFGDGVTSGTCEALIELSDFWPTLAVLASSDADPPAGTYNFARCLHTPTHDPGRDYAFAGYRNPNGPGPYVIYRRMVKSADGPKLMILDDDGSGPGAEVELLVDGDDVPFEDEDLADELRDVLTAAGF